MWGLQTYQNLWQFSSSFTTEQFILATKQSLLKSSLKIKPSQNENLANKYDFVRLNKSKSSTSKANGLEYKLHKKKRPR